SVSPSRRTVRIPALANDQAHTHPVKPPPTMTTSVSKSPLKRGYEGRRVFGKRSNQMGMSRIGMNALVYLVPFPFCRHTVCGSIEDSRLMREESMSLTEQLDRLAGFEPAPYPVVSLYLDTRPNQHGRDQHQAFIRKELKARSRTYPSNSPERESLDRGIERITRFLDEQIDPSANSIAIFACSAGELFETIQSGGVLPQHALHIGDRPHLYPLA